MAIHYLSIDRIENITREQLKQFNDTRKPSSPLRPLVNLNIKVEFQDDSPIIAMTPYERDGMQTEEMKFIEIKTDKGWLPLNSFASKQFFDHSDPSDPKKVENTALCKFDVALIDIYDTIKTLGKEQIYKVSSLPYIGRTEKGKLYPATSYVLIKA